MCGTIKNAADTLTCIERCAVSSCPVLKWDIHYMWMPNVKTEAFIHGEHLLDLSVQNFCAGLYAFSAKWPMAELHHAFKINHLPADPTWAHQFKNATCCVFEHPASVCIDWVAATEFCSICWQVSGRLSLQSCLQTHRSYCGCSHTNFIPPREWMSRHTVPLNAHYCFNYAFGVVHIFSHKLTMTGMF